MKKTEEAGGPCVLPVVEHGQIQYFVDLGLRRFRGVKNPNDCLDFYSEKGRQMREQTGIVVCKECRMAAIISTAIDRKELRCMNCLALIVPRGIPPTLP